MEKKMCEYFSESKDKNFKNLNEESDNKDSIKLKSKKKFNHQKIKEA